MHPSLKYGSHLPVLMAAVQNTRGDILELGCGTFSTPYLHAVCVIEKRRVLTLDNDRRWLDYFTKDYTSEKHHFELITNWGRAKIDQKWDVVLVDHAPAERRIVEIKRLAQLAKYIIIHDSNGRYEKDYHYSRIYPLFRYQLDYTKSQPSTTVLSNFTRLKNLV